jgi:hypothetical protein
MRNWIQKMIHMMIIIVPVAAATASPLRILGTWIIKNTSITGNSLERREIKVDWGRIVPSDLP